MPEADYVTLDILSESEQARLAPMQFLGKHKRPLIIDEVQYAPSLFREIKILVEQNRQPGQFLLTGSQNFPLMENASVRQAYVACRTERACPLVKGSQCEAVPLSGEDGLLGRLGESRNECEAETGGAETGQSEIC